MEKLKREIELYVRSGYPCLALVSSEEDRAQELIEGVAQKLERRLYIWSVTNGWTIEGVRAELKSENVGLLPEKGEDRRSQFPVTAMEEVLQHGRGRELILYFKDLHTFFDEPKVVRKLMDLITTRKQRWTVVVTAPGFSLPDLIEKEVTLIDVPLPGEDELREVLMKNLKALARHRGSSYRVEQGLIERVVRAALGLTRRQANFVFRMAITTDRDFTESDLDLIAQQKRQIIAKTGILEYCEHQEKLDGIGGLDALKLWLQHRNGAFSDRAREYGLPQPKGVFLLGVQGCGKSLISKAIASYWHMPLLRMDVGALFSSYIGKTEENMRLAFRVAESVAPCVLWIDEVEKGFSGVSGSGNSDGGTSARVFGSFLTWMQEKTEPVFVVATANSIEALPPEFLRKGRFDEIFFVDLPTFRERIEIARIHLARKKRDPQHYDLQALAHGSEGFSGAEIEEGVVAAMYHAFPEDREFTTDDVLNALRETMPLSKTLSDKIDHLRTWARQRARWATTPEGDRSTQRTQVTGRLKKPQP